MRKCIICGARVRNRNPKTETCDPICTFARKIRVSRNEAAYCLAMQEQEELEYLDKVAPAVRYAIRGEVL